MVDRPDAVLAVIPVLALGGLALGRTVHVAESVAGVGGSLSGIPFAAIGLVAALGVIAHELFAYGTPAS
jgi:hypothetical protein